MHLGFVHWQHVVDYGTGEFLAYDGLIDEVRIYNRALSAEEIKALATANQCRSGAHTTGRLPTTAPNPPPPSD